MIPTALEAGMARNLVRSRATRFAIPVTLVGSLVLALAMLAGVGAAASQVAPKNTQPPLLSGTPEVGQTLSASTGTFSGTAPITYVFRYGRCDKNGGGCFYTGSTTQNTFKLTSDDLNHTVRVRVTATNKDGTDSATSAPSPVIKKASGGGGGGGGGTPTAKGCPSGVGPVNVSQTVVPARLNVDRFSVNPDPVGGSTRSIQVTIHVSNTCGQSVGGAVVQVLAVPFNQFSDPAEAPTDGGGNVTVTMNRLSGYPAARRQALLVLFVRARKTGDPILAGISTRRLVSVGVDLNR